jgi:hypothetical protein
LEVLRKNNGLVKPYNYIYVLSFIEDSDFYEKETRKLIKSELSIMGDGLEDVEIYPIVEIACPDDRSGGAPDAGDIQGDTAIPRDFSNVDKIDLRFREVDVSNIKEEIAEDEKQQAEQEIFEEEFEREYEKKLKEIYARFDKRK